MAGWNGSGGFTLTYSWAADKAAGIPITASRMDSQFADLSVQGFGNTLTRDGQGQPSANLPMNGFRHTGAAAGVASGDYITMGQISTVQVTATGSTTPRSLANRFADVVNVLDYGADNTGADECSAAFEAACLDNKRVYVPPGIYKVDPIVLTGIDNLWLDGGGNQSTVLSLNTAGVVLTLDNCQSFIISNLTIRPADSAFAASSAIVVTNGCGNGIVDRCWIYNFTYYGVAFNGVIGTQMSGHRVSRCLLLSNGAAGIYKEYSNDWWIEDNQFGIIQSSHIPNNGARLVNSSAGTYTSNYHWDNTVDLSMDDCAYLRIVHNRIEEAKRQAVQASGCVQIIFTNNSLYANSKSSSGTYNCIEIDDCNYWTISDNQIFDWTGGSSQVLIGIRITNSDKMSIANSFITGWVTAPVQIDGFTFSGDINVDQYYIGSTDATVAAGATVYLGPNGAQAVASASLWPALVNGFVVFMYAASTVAPGVGESFVYTLRKNGVDTAMTMTTPAALFGVSTESNGVVLDPDQDVTVKLVTSGGAAVGYHRYVVGIVKA